MNSIMHYVLNVVVSLKFVTVDCMFLVFLFICYLSFLLVVVIF